MILGSNLTNKNIVKKQMQTNNMNIPLLNGIKLQQNSKTPRGYAE